MEHGAPEVAEGFFPARRQVGGVPAPVRERRLVRADQPREERVIDADLNGQPTGLAAQGLRRLFLKEVRDGL